MALIFRLKIIFSFGAQNGRFSCYFCEFFCLISPRLKFIKVDEGLLRDKITCYYHFLSYVFWYYKHKHAK